MPYSVPPPPPPVVNYISPEETRNPTPSAIPPSSSIPNFASQSPAEAHSLLSRCSVQSSACTPAASPQLAQSARLAQPVAAAELAPDTKERAHSLGTAVEVGVGRNNGLTAQETAQGNTQSIPPSEVVPVSPASTEGSVRFQAVPEIDALISVTQARSVAPASEPEFDLSDLTTPSTQLPSSSRPNPSAPSTSPDPTSSSGESADSGQTLTIPEQSDRAPSTPSTPGTTQAPSGLTVPIDTAQVGEVIELTADRQEYDTLGQIFEAEGNVVMRFRQAILTADRLRVNIPNRLAVAEGNAVLTRGQQALRGARFTYNFGLEQGTIFQARGEVALNSAADFDANQPPTVGTAINPAQSVGEQIATAQPLQVTGSTGGLVFGVNTPNQTGPGQQGSSLTRLRFEAEQLDFNAQGWEASNVRVTNDPFSPPELELRSPRVTYTTLSPTRTEIRARNPRVVFDQGFSLPLLRDRVVIDRERRNPGLVSFGYDERDRGGFFLEREFEVFSNPAVTFSLTPQILVQRAIEEDGFLSPSSYGLIANLEAALGTDTTIVGNAVFTTLDLQDLEDKLRASLRVQQRLLNNHTLALEYSYRDRLFNGSLGFQSVQSSLGLVLTSPLLNLGTTGITLRYQGGVQFVNSETDRLDLLPVIRDNNRIDLTRYQAAATLSRPFLLWYAPPLPATPTEGLRYTPNPIVPYVALVPSVQGVVSAYSSGDTQTSLTGSISLSGQLGHFSRPFFDYTGFNVSYSQTALSGESPFLFDRVADQQVLSLGITQQIYGPFRFGVQTSYNLEDGDNIDTVYTLEYSRRSYSLSVNFSPIREAASLSFRINDFNWSGDPGPFSGLNQNTNVINGVRQ